MKSWSEVSQVVESVYAGTRPNATMLAFEVPVHGGARNQKAFLRYERMQTLDGSPGLEFLQLDSAIGLISQVDLGRAVAHVGQLVVGSLGYVPAHGSDGILTISVKFPLDFVSAGEEGTLLLLVNLIASAAAGTEQLLQAHGGPSSASRSEPATGAMQPAGAGGDEGQIAFEEALKIEQSGDLPAAEEAYRRGDELGHGLSATNLGCLLANRGKMDAAEAAFRRGDERGDLNGAYFLGVLLESHRHDVDGAAAAWNRADEGGHAAAAYNLGCLHQKRGSFWEAEAAWRRAAERGDGGGALNLGVLLQKRGDEAGAVAAWHRADELGVAAGSAFLGQHLEQAGDFADAEAAYRRADEKGHPEGAFGLGSLLSRSGDHAGAYAAMARAAQLGHTGAPHVMEAIAREHPAAAGS